MRGKSSTCRGCGARIVWGLTKKNGKAVPMDPPEKRYVNVGTGTTASPEVEIQRTWLSHFATCPKRDDFRRTS